MEVDTYQTRRQNHYQQKPEKSNKPSTSKYNNYYPKNPNPQPTYYDTNNDQNDYNQDYDYSDHYQGKNFQIPASNYMTDSTIFSSVEKLRTVDYTGSQNKKKVLTSNN